MGPLHPYKHSQSHLHGWSRTYTHARTHTHARKAFPEPSAGLVPRPHKPVKPKANEVHRPKACMNTVIIIIDTASSIASLWTGRNACAAWQHESLRAMGPLYAHLEVKVDVWEDDGL